MRTPKYSTDKRREQVLNFINNYWARYKSAPSIREIADGIGISSTSVVNYHIGKLREFGYLAQCEPALSRQITPIWVREAIGVAAVEIFGGEHDPQQVG